MNRRTIILADSYQHKDVYASLLFENDGLSNTDVLSVSSWLNNQIKSNTDDSELFIKAYRIISGLNDSLNLLKESSKYPFFTNEVLAFMRTLYLFNINPDNLPDDKDLEKELKLIIDSLEKLDFKEKKYNCCLSNLADISDIQLADTLFFDSRKKYIYDILKSKGCQTINKSENRLKNVSVFTSQNKRNEIESIAQYIVSSSKPLESFRIIVGDSSYVETIERVFSRYNIPIECSLENFRSHIINKYIKLVEYLDDPNRDTLLAVLLSNALGFDSSKLAVYQEIWKPENMDELLQIPESSMKNVADYLEGIKAIISDNREKLERLTKDERDVFSIATLAYDIIKDSISNDLDLEVVLEIKHVLEDNLKDIDNIELLKHFILSIGINRVSASGVWVTSMQNSFTNTKETTIVVGTNALPSFNFFNGVFDEDYFARIDYPDKEARYNQTINETRKSLCMTENLIISEAVADYNGKAFILPSFWDEFLEEYEVKRNIWPLKEADIYRDFNHQITKTNAQNIFIKDGRINGSVSSFEKYFSCPYSYFISKGLDVDEISHDIDNAKLGTTLHSIMEELVRTYGKKYASLEHETIRLLVDKHFEQYYITYPHRKSCIDIYKQQIYSHLISSLDYIKLMEEKSNYVPSRFEERFNTTIKTSTYPINLKGIIDRIDETEDSYRIIDYKSGDKQLNDNNIRAGLSLQLLTYLFYIQNEIEKNPDGAYYLSFKEENTNVSAGSFNASKLEHSYYDRTDWLKLYFKNHSIEGYSFAEPDNELLSFYKEKKVKNANEYKDILNQLYECLAKSISDGIINVRPGENDCRYCSYKGICHYYGDTYKIKEKIIVAKEQDEQN